jgi:trehalose 6-phosphate synthase/phosphatase
VRESGRVLLVSHRLPVTVTSLDGRARIAASAGGVATGLLPLHEGSGGLWIGCPGELDELAAEERERVARELEARGLVAVELEREMARRYYEGYANGVLWPLFHYLSYQLPLEARDHDAYAAANERFAEVVAASWRPGDLIWVHDYQLLLLPELLRRRLPEARIGLFLHIPFPSSEVFRALPRRAEILEGMLGADLIGFHTAPYLRHFASTVLRILGAPTDVDALLWRGRQVQLGIFPMGIDARAFASTATSPGVEQEVRKLRGEDRARLLVGIDRLDYTKGIPRRLLAYERLLQRHPDLRGHVRFVQVAVPSRRDVEAYQVFRSQADELIGRIHGAFATPHWVPLHWIYRALSREEVVALYRAADVLLVTPLRDGMNLVAKEFVASRIDEDGVLVLSEFAGAAAELAEAILVNPFDVEASASAYYRALTMSEGERRRRMRALRRRVTSWDADRWARSFVERLASVGRRPEGRAVTPGPELDALLERLRAAPALVLLLDYDGTLVPFAPTPDLATPDAALLELLGDLAARPATVVHVVSGRSRETLEGWLGSLAIGLHAEHGLCSRAPGDSDWEVVPASTAAWRERVIEILEDFAARTPGALLETKSAGVAWHYRAADREYGERQARELHLHLTETLSNVPVQILPGEKVLEVRPHGVSKGRVVEFALRKAPAGSLLCALGDDRTDEDLFAALPEGSVAVHVGPLPSRAAYRLAAVGDARGLLRRLLDAPA